MTLPTKQKNLIDYILHQKNITYEKNNDIHIMRVIIKQKQQISYT